MRYILLSLCLLSFTARGAGPCDDIISTSKVVIQDLQAENQILRQQRDEMARQAEKASEPTLFKSIEPVLLVVLPLVGFGIGRLAK